MMYVHHLHGAGVTGNVVVLGELENKVLVLCGGGNGCALREVAHEAGGRRGCAALLNAAPGIGDRNNACAGGHASEMSASCCFRM